jgi:hypothetical protein
MTVANHMDGESRGLHQDNDSAHDHVLLSEQEDGNKRLVLNVLSTSLENGQGVTASIDISIKAAEAEGFRHMSIEPPDGGLRFVHNFYLSIDLCCNKKFY